MITNSILYRCLIAILLCLLNLTQWLHQLIVQFISRHRYTITVNIDVSRNDPRSINKNQIDKIQFNKPTDVLAIIINEHISDNHLCKFIVNAILFFRTLNIQHLVIYDYQGYIKAREASIMDYVHSYDKKRMSFMKILHLGFFLFKL
jgi:hypothetical protein